VDKGGPPAIGKEISNTITGLFNLGNDAAAAVSGEKAPQQVPDQQPSTPGEKTVMNGTALAMLVVPESKAADLEKVGVALREEKIVKQVETVAKYSDGALTRSAKKATGQIEKHLDLLRTSASEAARSIKADLRHNAERLEAIIRETTSRIWQ